MKSGCLDTTAPDVSRKLRQEASEQALSRRYASFSEGSGTVFSPTTHASRSTWGRRALLLFAAATLAAVPALAQHTKHHAKAGTAASKHHTTTASSHKALTAHTHASAHGSHAATVTRRVTVTRHGRTVHRVVVVRRKAKRRALSAHEQAKTAQIQHAFVASEQLRPMAQQLGDYRSAAAYAGVQSYARSHSGPAAAAAYLALGHAYLLDHRYSDALQALASANAAGNQLDDYADYFAAQANLQSSQLPAADAILSTFTTKYPDSIFNAQVPVLEANLLLQQNQPAQALTVLRRYAATPSAGKADYLLALGKASQATGATADATAAFRRALMTSPLSSDAALAQKQLQDMNAWNSLPLAERRHHADALFNGGKFENAAIEYRALAAESGIAPVEHDSLLLSAAACDLKLKRLNAGSLSSIPDSSDENGARRMYLQMELARSDNDTGTQQSIVRNMESRFPTSSWLAEALFSSGNMYLLRTDYPTAIGYYLDLAQRFPSSKNADNAHWRAAWLNYRLRNFPEAERLMDEQLAQFRGGKNVPSALYWRGRLYQDQQHQTTQAVAYFEALTRVYPHYYYTVLAQQRLASLGNGVAAVDVPLLDALQPEQIPTLTEDMPQDDPHLAKARLLANAGLNDYLSPEIHAAEGSDEWGALAEAKLYASFGETYRAMRALKRGIPFYTSAPIDELPLDYWRILFPQSYWSTIQAESAKNGLDPYMVASLIRQESEFNPRVVSYANAWGLMQLLPPVGKEVARTIGYDSHLPSEALLDPQINIKLGTVYLKRTLDKFGGHQEYAFAAYNAGDSRVTQWQAANDYTGIDEFVESIPFTETRDYVQSIMRNEQIYRELDQSAKTRATIDAVASQGLSPAN